MYSTHNTNDYLYIGVMISYLERILQIIADFFGKLTGGIASTTAPAVSDTTTGVAETTIVAS